VYQRNENQKALTGGIMGERRSGSAGATLIELMVGLIVMGGLLGMAVPAMSAMLNSVRLDSATQSMVSSLQLARSEAIKRGTRVVLCKSPSGEDCDHTSGWEDGWIVFQDRNNNAMVDEGENILHKEQPLAANLRLTGNSTVLSYVSYTPFGQAKMTSGAFQAGTLTACMSSKSRAAARQIVINIAGRARTQMATLDHCS
jgi:type IV fimbrial biogenesis protein FimT